MALTLSGPLSWFQSDKLVRGNLSESLINLLLPTGNIKEAHRIFQEMIVDPLTMSSGHALGSGMPFIKAFPIEVWQNMVVSKKLFKSVDAGLELGIAGAKCLFIATVIASLAPVHNSILDAGWDYPNLAAFAAGLTGTIATFTNAIPNISNLETNITKSFSLIALLLGSALGLGASEVIRENISFDVSSLHDSLPWLTAATVGMMTFLSMKVIKQKWDIDPPKSLPQLITKLPWDSPAVMPTGVVGTALTIHAAAKALQYLPIGSEFVNLAVSTSAALWQGTSYLKNPLIFGAAVLAGNGFKQNMADLASWHLPLLSLGMHLLSSVHFHDVMMGPAQMLNNNPMLSCGGLALLQFSLGLLEMLKNPLALKLQLPLQQALCTSLAYSAVCNQNWAGLAAVALGLAVGKNSKDEEGALKTITKFAMSALMLGGLGVHLYEMAAGSTANEYAVMARDTTSLALKVASTATLAVLPYLTYKMASAGSNKDSNLPARVTIGAVGAGLSYATYPELFKDGINWLGTLHSIPAALPIIGTVAGSLGVYQAKSNYKKLTFGAIAAASAYQLNLLREGAPPVLLGILSYLCIQRASKPRPGRVAKALFSSLGVLSGFGALISPITSLKYDGPLLSALSSGEVTFVGPAQPLLSALSSAVTAVTQYVFTTKIGAITGLGALATVGAINKYGWKKVERQLPLAALVGAGAIAVDVFLPYIISAGTAVSQDPEHYATPLLGVAATLGIAYYQNKDWIDDQLSSFAKLLPSLPTNNRHFKNLKKSMKRLLPNSRT